MTLSKEDIEIWNALAKTINKLGMPKKSPRTAKAVKTTPVYTKLDLHGYTINNANKATRDFIYDSYQKRLGTVEIVTGNGGPVNSIVSEFPKWFEVPPLSNYVRSIKSVNNSNPVCWIIKLKAKTR